MSSAQPDKPDHWTAQNYKAAADFVHKLTKKVLIDLAAQPGDRILDLGCGDGALTVQLAELVQASGSIHGLDSSQNFISHAQATYSGQDSKHKNLTFELQDCSALDEWVSAAPPAGSPPRKAAFDRVFSNAALHWILRDPSRRSRTFSGAFDALKPGGVFVFEMGGAGNVAEMHAALVGALMHAGVPTAEAQEASPWFFPSDVLIAKMLQEAGFEVEKAELEYRPTRLEEGPGGGVEGWVRLMGAKFLEKVPENKRDEVVKEVVEASRPNCIRPEGGEWLGYTRCRAVARKPLR